jgi:hypothetical protein
MISKRPFITAAWSNARGRSPGGPSAITRRTCLGLATRFFADFIQPTGRVRGASRNSTGVSDSGIQSLVNVSIRLGNLAGLFEPNNLRFGNNLKSSPSQPT